MTTTRNYDSVELRGGPFHGQRIKVPASPTARVELIVSRGNPCRAIYSGDTSDDLLRFEECIGKGSDNQQTKRQRKERHHA